MVVVITCWDQRKEGQSVVMHLKGWPLPCRRPSVCQLLPNDDEEEDDDEPKADAGGGDDDDFD